MKSNHLLIAFLLLSFYSVVSGKNYYLDNNGDNSASGTTPDEAWSGIANVNSLFLKAGDTVFFRGGQRFYGSLYLDKYDSGSAEAVIVFTSYGSGKAIIDAGDGGAFYAYNTEGIGIENLEFSGSGKLSNKKEGIFFYADISTGRKFKNIQIRHVDIHGFGKPGLCFGSWGSSYPGFENVVVSHLRSFDNETGMSSYDMAEWKASLYGHKNFLIEDCEFSGNISSGIVLGGVDSGLIQYCRASNNGSTGNGVVAIWAWSSKNLVFQHCIANGTVTAGPDGGGYDLDGGTENCIIQYCYSFNNAGPGYMHCDYPYSRPTRNNIIRYCLSENDGRKPANGRCSYLFISWGNGLESCHMYNNTGYITDNGSYTVYGMWGYLLFGNGDSPHINNCTARNNIIYVKGNNHYLVNLDGNSKPMAPIHLLLQGNCYFADGTGSARWLLNNTVYNSLESWQDASGQEILQSQRTGFTIDPMLFNPGGGGELTDPHKLNTLEAYTLLPASALIDSGLNIQELFDMDICPVDFYGNPSFQGSSQDPGIHESQKVPDGGIQSRNLIECNIFPNPADRKLSLTVISESNIRSLDLFSENGNNIDLKNCQITGKTGCFASPSVPGIYLLKIGHLNGSFVNRKILVL